MGNHRGGARHKKNSWPTHMKLRPRETPSPSEQDDQLERKRSPTPTSVFIGSMSTPGIAAYPHAHPLQKRQKPNLQRLLPTQPEPRYLRRSFFQPHHGVTPSLYYLKTQISLVLVSRLNPLTKEILLSKPQKLLNSVKHKKSSYQTTSNSTPSPSLLTAISK